MFARHGYDQTTMQELAATMGLATGALYHYFGAKEQLLRAICDQLMEPLLQRAQALITADGPADEQLRALVRMWVAHVVEHRDHMLVFQQERHVIESGPPWRAVRASRKAFERLVADVLDACAGGPAETTTPAGRCSRCSGWSTTPRSGTGRAARSHPSRSPTATWIWSWARVERRRGGVAAAPVRLVWQVGSLAPGMPVRMLRVGGFARPG